MTPTYRIGDWLVNPEDSSVQRDDKRIKIEPKAMDLLLVLVDADGRVVLKNDIFDRVWTNQVIADHVLYNLIANLRKVLEDNPQNPQYILTVVKKGYRLGKAVEVMAQSANPETHEKTPFTDDNTPSRPWKLLFVAALILLLTASGWLMAVFDSPRQQNPATINDSNPDKNIQTIEVSEPTIAVLPFDVFDDEPDTAYFADGLAEEVIHQLAGIPGLAVISRTSSFSFRDKGLTVQSIAEKLNAGFILEGSIRRDQTALRVTIQLINSKTDTHLWSSVFDVKKDNIFELQNNISTSVARSLLPEYNAQAIINNRKHPTQSEAYQHYLRGNAMTSRGTLEQIKLASDEYQKAIEIAPDYALAQVAVALNTMLLYQYREIDEDSARTTTLEAVEKALKSQPFLASAYAAKGLMHINFNEPQQAAENFKKALEIDPSLHLAHHNYGYLLWTQNKHAEALRHFQIALAHNPMSTFTNFGVADSLFAVGNLSAAHKQYQHCLALHPDYPACHLGLANFYRVTAQTTLAKEHMSLAKKGLEDNNLYWITANMLDALWHGAFPRLQQFSDELDAKLNGEQTELQVKTLLYAKLGQLPEWIIKLTASSQSEDATLDQKYAMALAHYLNSDCTQAINSYQTVLSSDTALSQFFAAAYATSHQLNLADCYLKRQQTDLAEQAMNQAEQQFNSYKTTDYAVPGLIIVEAKLAALKNDQQTVARLMKKIRQQDWALQWMLDIDPNLKTFK